MQRQAIRLTIRGRVQGVGYRAWAADQAQRLGLDGWVRNRRDGSVELLAVGPDTRIEQMIEACRRGPPAARVTEVDHHADHDDGGIGFRHLPTA